MAGLLLVVGAPMAGVEAGLSVVADAGRLPADWRQVPAVVTHKAPPPTAVTGVGPNGEEVRATVRWHEPGHDSRTGTTLVAPGTPAGTRTTIWIDPAGAVHQPPADSRGVKSEAIAVGLLVGSGTALAACGGGAAVCCALNRRRAADLDREWASVGPVWRRHRT
ncbi:hypothetical protein RVR_532 [Actinacidiphila reveromycinica]|uniref:Uncharacterized protein n=1 Tax=Actinacidiphila reveromycinica TaxID=659352 RepID=A0A7U3WGX3_9ACTN|nr:hypothetical protein RVR_532 [Streptomyces sp. SN-593]